MLGGSLPIAAIAEMREEEETAVSSFRLEFHFKEEVTVANKRTLK